MPAIIRRRAGSYKPRAITSQRKPFWKQSSADFTGALRPPAELPMRAGLVATQIMGLAVTRYILKVPPVVAMDRAQCVRLLGPTMQRPAVRKSMRL